MAEQNFTGRYFLSGHDFYAITKEGKLIGGTIGEKLKYAPVIEILGFDPEYTDTLRTMANSPDLETRTKLDGFIHKFGTEPRVGSSLYIRFSPEYAQKIGICGHVIPSVTEII
jgi:hypothetical protein